MDTQLLQDLSGLVVEIAQKASESIMDVYLSKTVAIRAKKDGSPVTEADINSHRIIIQEIKKLQSQFPILSEEGKDIPYEERKDWEYFWMVDPLDGTSSMIRRPSIFLSRYFSGIFSELLVKWVTPFSSFQENIAASLIFTENGNAKRISR